MSKVVGYLGQKGIYFGLGVLLVGYLGYRLVQWISNSANSSTKKAANIVKQEFSSKKPQAPTTNSSTATTTATGTTSQTTSAVAKKKLEIKSQAPAQPKLYISDGPLAQIDNKTVYGIGGTDLIVKFNVKPKAPPIHWEYFAYLISEALGLHVVPPTSLVNAGELSDEKIFERLPGLKELLLSQFESKIMVLQTKMEDHAGASNPRRYDLSNFQRVVFFNLIIGRMLCNGHDSMVDKAKTLWETSNTKCGSKVSQSADYIWPLSHDQTKDPILDDLMEHILKLDPTCLDAVEKTAQEKSPDTYDAPRWKNIKENLVLVQQKLRFLKSDGKVYWTRLVLKLKIPSSV